MRWVPGYFLVTGQPLFEGRTDLALAASNAASGWSPVDTQRWWANYRPDGRTRARQTEVATIAVDLSAR
jgi:hypothetical protein